MQRGFQPPRLEANAGDVLPERPVEASGTRRPLQVTTWRAALSLCALTCSRSTEESTKREVPPTVPSSPSTCHGSKRLPELELDAQSQLAVP